ncbi:hypothetical protein L2E82_35406 [Cichorium intybus]|uniref:Uncharacterized protein n=1 Tax=Cichorium intybus TaxID=13427 RepID=A0ACB9BNU6_CICIN|nr:hypothetical protein L2E82_35406 [Cichorium intybus]
MVQPGFVCGINGYAAVNTGGEGTIVEEEKMEDGMVEDVGSSDDDGFDDVDSMVVRKDLKQDAGHITIEEKLIDRPTIPNLMPLVDLLIPVSLKFSPKLLL